MLLTPGTLRVNHYFFKIHIISGDFVTSVSCILDS